MDRQVGQWVVSEAGTMAEQWSGRLVAWIAGQMAVCSAGSADEFWAEQDGPAVGFMVCWDDGGGLGCPVGGWTSRSSSGLSAWHG